MITEEAPPQAPLPRRPKRWVRWLVVLLVLGALAIASAGAYLAWAMGGTDGGKTVTVEIPTGATGAEIADILEERDVVRSALAFRLIARIRGVDTGLRPGVYDMRVGLGVDGVIALLRKGIEPKFVRISIPEGKTVIEIARIVGQNTQISEQDFLAEARSGEHRISIMPRGSKDLEGMLFPKTYDVTETMDAGDLIERMLGQFERETASLDLGRAQRLGLTPYEIVVVASLIEREARVQKDRPLISSVIHNRLAIPMRLQIDASVQYGIQRQTGEYKDPLTQEDYTRARSAWNTYLIDGLPPTPIAAAGLPSLRAALDPADTDFLYYRLSNDGVSHCFAETSGGHAACANR